MRHFLFFALLFSMVFMGSPAQSETADKMGKDKASAGLITLATTGNPKPLQAELGGEIVDSKGLMAEAGGLLDLGKDEHLAPSALVTPKGETYAMVAPTITKDNFIFKNASGQIMRMDVGSNEGHHMPFVVNEIMEDGGTPWYVEFWYWITGQ